MRVDVEKNEAKMKQSWLEKGLPMKQPDTSILKSDYQGEGEVSIAEKKRTDDGNGVA